MAMEHRNVSSRSKKVVLMEDGGQMNGSQLLKMGMICLIHHPLIGMESMRLEILDDYLIARVFTFLLG